MLRYRLWSDLVFCVRVDQLVTRLHTNVLFALLFDKETTHTTLTLTPTLRAPAPNLTLLALTLTLTYDTDLYAHRPFPHRPCPL